MPPLATARFIQGDGYPTLYRYNSSNVLQETVAMPYVRDDGSKSYIRIFFDPYPDNKILHHDLLSGNINEDKPVGFKARCEIKYSSILASNLLPIYTCIINSLKTSGDYLKLNPRNDWDGDAGLGLWTVVFKGTLPLESANMWAHNVLLQFSATSLILPGNLILAIPPTT